MDQQSFEYCGIDSCDLCGAKMRLFRTFLETWEVRNFISITTV